MDKEHEIDEFVRGSIKDPETEKKIKELYEKAHGLDIVKPRLQATRQELQEMKGEVQQYRQGVDALRQDYTRGDFEAFFKRLNISEEKVLQWVLDKVNYNELPPEQRQGLDKQKSAEQRAWDAEQRAEQLSQQFEQHSQQSKGFALQVALEKPDVKTFAGTYESRTGKPGSFREAVCELGEYTWYKSQGQIDLTPEQAVQKLMEQYGSLLSGGSPQAPAPGATPTQSSATSPGAIPTIPNVGGRSTSPTQSRPKNLDDIRKLAASFQ